MKNEKEKEICPTCGQVMKFIKSEKQPDKFSKTKIEDVNEEAFEYI